MPIFSGVNWDEAGERVRYEDIEPGTYPAILASRGEPATVVNNTDPPIPAFWCTFQMQYPITGGKVQVIPIKGKHALAGDGHKYTKELVRAAGLPATGKNEVFDSSILHGRRVRIQVRPTQQTKGEYEGQWNLRILAVLPAEDATSIISSSSAPSGTDTDAAIMAAIRGQQKKADPPPVVTPEAREFDVDPVVAATPAATVEQS